MTEEFTILSNRLAQRRGSAVTVGVALFITSKPNGTAISVRSLRAHFTEGEALLSRALNELEGEGWLKRVIVRGPDGRLTTRTYVYTLPEGAAPDEPRARGLPQRDPEPKPRLTQELGLETAAAPAPEPAASGDPGEATPEAVAEPGDPAPSTDGATDTARTPGAAGRAAVEVLSSLGARDSRLILTRTELDRLAPRVDAWLSRGVEPDALGEMLSRDLPERLRTRPAHLLAWRLRELVPPAPPAASGATRTRVPLPLQNCDGCDRAHRAATPGPCPACRTPGPA